MKKIIIFLFIIIINFIEIKAQWTKVSGYGMINSLKVDGNNILYLKNGPYLILSTDNGDSWKILDDFQVETFYYYDNIFIKNNIILALSIEPTLSNYTNTIFKSSNFGISWDTLLEKNGFSRYADVPMFITYNYNKFFLGSTAGTSPYYFSSDNGNSWECAYQGPYTAHRPGTADRIAFRNSVAYILESFILWKSIDSMKTWNKIVGDLILMGFSNKILSLKASGNNIFILDEPYFLKLSTDEGNTWKEIGSSCCKSKNIATIATCGDIVYAFSDSGLFVSRDNGINWNYIYSPNFGLDSYYSIGFNDNYIFLGTTYGIYRAPLKDCMIDTTETSVPEPQNPSTELTISPNPASDILNINGNINNYPIKIYNIEGIKQIEAENTKEIDISKLPQGVYYIQIGNYFTKFVKI